MELAGLGMSFVEVDGQESWVVFASPSVNFPSRPWMFVRRYGYRRCVGHFQAQDSSQTAQKERQACLLKTTQKTVFVERPTKGKRKLCHVSLSKNDKLMVVA